MRRFASSPKLTQPVIMTAQNGTNYALNKRTKPISVQNLNPLSSASSMVNLSPKKSPSHNQTYGTLPKRKTLPQSPKKGRRQLPKPPPPEKKNGTVEPPPSGTIEPPPAVNLEVEPHEAKEEEIKVKSRPVSMERDSLSPDIRKIEEMRGSSPMRQNTPIPKEEEDEEVPTRRSPVRHSPVRHSPVRRSVEREPSVAKSNVGSVIDEGNFPRNVTTW